MARLALKFFDSPQARILDTDTVDIGYEWRVGRTTETNKPDIAFVHETVSRTHAFVRCVTQYDREQWQIKHVGRNPTYRQIGNAQRQPLQAEYWVNIHDDDVFLFGFQNAGFRATTAIDETLQQADFIEDDSPTINETIQKAIAENAAAAQKTNERPWYAEIALLILNGPEGFPNWLWWLCLLGSALLYVVLKYGG